MSGSEVSGMLLGLCFGLGAIFVPSIAFGVGMAYIGSRLRVQLKGWLPHIERLSAWLLVLTGISSLARW
jgi:thiol:disulfide interchange protein DsbD